MELVDKALAAAAEAWPQVRVSRERFTAFAAPLGEDALNRFGAELVLACACGDGAAEAIRAFETHLLTAARLAISSIDGREQFVTEAMQRVRAHLLVGEHGKPARITHYAGRGPLHAWVAVSGARIALQMIRQAKQPTAREVQADDLALAMTAVSTGTPELDLIKQQHRAVFTTALRDAVDTLEARLRAVLRLYFVDELSLDEIGVVYAVHRATVARWIQRARAQLLAETRRLLAERLGITETELDRLSVMVQSQLDISLSELLAP